MEMGESRRMRDRILNGTPCIYCYGYADTIEHMPPRIMFLNKSRPKGMEFASCKKCNTESGMADAVASMIARLDKEDDLKSQSFIEARILRNKILKSNPALIDDLFENAQTIYKLGSNGIVKRYETKTVDSKILTQYLKIFSSKMALSLYYTHVGKYLTKTGSIFHMAYLNSGLEQKSRDIILSIMPMQNSLKQGEWEVNDQFEYKYNTDKKSIFAGHVKFHKGLEITIFAIQDNADVVKLLRDKGLTETMPGNIFEPKRN